MKEKKYFYLYKVINLLNNRVYIGIHKTDNLNDGYMGSGKKLKEDIKHQGKENFKKEILQFFNSYSDALEEEQTIVNKSFLKNDVYNIVEGGRGGFEYINLMKLGGFKNRHHTEKAKKAISKKMKGKRGSFLGKYHSEETKKKIGKKSKGRNTGRILSEEIRKKISYSLRGKKHSEETKKKMSLQRKGRVFSKEWKERLSESAKKAHERKKLAS